MKKLRGIFLIGLLLTMLSVGATTKTWVGINPYGSYSWAAYNWSPSGVPTANDDVIIANAPNICILSTAHTFKSLTVEPTAVLRLNASADITILNDATIEANENGSGAIYFMTNSDLHVEGKFTRENEMLTECNMMIGTAKAMGNPSILNSLDNKLSSLDYYGYEYTYSTADGCMKWVNIPETGIPCPDEGYDLWASVISGQTDPLHFTYQMNNSNIDYTQPTAITMPLLDNTHDVCPDAQGQGGSYAGWGFLANPYLTTISLASADNFINIEDYEPIAYIWSDNQYESMNIGNIPWPTGNLYFDRYLPSNEGFMIRTNTDVSTPSALQINSSAQVQTTNNTAIHKNAYAPLTNVYLNNNPADYPSIPRTGEYELLFQVNMEYNVNSTTNRNTAFFWVSDGDPLGGGGIISTNSTGFKDSKTYYGQEYGYADVIAQSVVADYDRDTYVPDIGFAIANGITSPNNYRSGDASTATINGTWLDSYEDYTKLRTDEFIPNNSTGTLLKFYFNNDIDNITFTGEIDPDILDGNAKNRAKLPVKQGKTVKGSKSRPTNFTMSFDGISELYTNGNYVVYMHIYTYSTGTQKWTRTGGFQITDATTLDNVSNNMVNKQYLFQIVRAGGKKDATVLPFSNASINRNNSSYRIIGLEQQAKQIEIYSVSGAKLQTIEAQNADVIDIATNELSGGVYLARIVGLDNRQKTMKFLVQ